MEIREYNEYQEDEILRLYSSVGWTAYTSDATALERAFEGSLLTLAAYDGSELCGIIRTVGDGSSIVYIQDILVSPQKQRHGIGRELIKTVLERFPSVRQIFLTTDDSEETKAFYRSCGFREMKDQNCVSFFFDRSEIKEHRMDKKEFIRRLEEYGFPKSEYMIMSGGSMLMRGLRESTGDFDLCVSEKLAQTLDLEHCPLNDKGYYAPYEDMELTVNLGERPYDIVDGFQCETLESVLEFKKSLMRPKDIKDIEIIERYLKSIKEND
ncbi:MAG: GNAT family N-acetyltransferase [Oscillospiraceae bacterium]|nr:GNAT family N-acetyltransferase [Oscillospiraceae bacterium]